MEYYSLLERVTPSPLHRLNRAVAVAEWQGPGAGLAVLEGFEPPAWLTDSYQWQQFWPIYIGAAEAPRRQNAIGM